MSFPRRIYLVGLPGVGKSTVGKHLASELGLDFTDLDDRIEQSAGKKISQLFQEDGEIYFRAVEADELRNTASDHGVIATGGGAPCFHDNMQWMKENGRVIFLNPPLDVVIQRTANAQHRPLIKDDAKATILDLFEKRSPYYTQAHLESRKSESPEIVSELRTLLKIV